LNSLGQQKITKIRRKCRYPDLLELNVDEYLIPFYAINDLLSYLVHDD